MYAMDDSLQDLPLSTTSFRGDLLYDIDRLSQALVRLYVDLGEPPHRGQLRHQHLDWLPWHRREVLIWQLGTTRRRLWLGTNGVIYRQFVIHDKPYSYWMRVRIWERDMRGLIKLRDRLQELHAELYRLFLQGAV